MNAGETTPEDEAWMDGWETAGSFATHYDCKDYTTSTEREAFVAGWNARMEHIALGYQHDVPFPK